MKNYFDMIGWGIIFKSFKMVDAAKFSSHQSVAEGILDRVKWLFNSDTGIQIDAYLNNLLKHVGMERFCRALTKVFNARSASAFMRECGYFAVDDRANCYLFAELFKKAAAYCNGLEAAFKADQIGKKELVTELTDMLDIMQDIFIECAEIESQYVEAVKPSWNNIGDKFTIENKNSQPIDKFRFFVNAGYLGWQKKRYPVISASYVDNTFSKELYKNRKFGWLFNCDLDDVVCMSASDCYVTAVNCFDASLRLKMNELSIIGFLSKEQLAHDTKCLYNVVPASFYGVYPILSPECLAQSEDFNEVVLTGDVKPSGVFVIVDDAVEPLVANELIAVSIASGVPLTLWSLHNRQIRTISTDYCIHNFERVSKILQDGSLEFEL